MRCISSRFSNVFKYMSHKLWSESNKHKVSSQAQMFPDRKMHLELHSILYNWDSFFYHIQRQHWEDVTVLDHIRQPGNDNTFTAAYQYFIHWQHGPLGQRNRLVIPSCCFCRIRELVPDPDWQCQAIHRFDTWSLNFLPGSLEPSYSITSIHTPAYTSSDI